MAKGAAVDRSVGRFKKSAGVRAVARSRETGRTVALYREGPLWVVESEGVVERFVTRVAALRRGNEMLDAGAESRLEKSA